ncbi:MAG TPA: hemerythrin domain-containing protein [Bryobacteraceae bacterium]
MTVIKSTNVLEREHEAIHRVIAAVSITAEKLDADEPFDFGILLDFSAFLHDFSEAHHHAKEERLLFPLLEAKGVPASGCPIAVLHHEHEKGRALLKQLDDAIQVFLTTGAAKEDLTQTLRSMVQLYVDHMWKEDYLLLPMANKVLSDEDQAALCDQFESLEQELGSAKYREMEQLSRTLDPTHVRGDAK